MKKYFIFAAVALVALCNVSCSSSDDDDEPFNPTVKYDEPAAASAATAFAIPTASQPTATDGTNTTKLQQVDITESGSTVQPSISPSTQSTQRKAIRKSISSSRTMCRKVRLSQQLLQQPADVH